MGSFEMLRFAIRIEGWKKIEFCQSFKLRMARNRRISAILEPKKIHGRLNPFLKWRLGCGEFRVAHMA